MPFSNIDKPNKYFNTVTYAGAGTTTQSVTGTGFSPDWIWIKNRTDGYSHVLQDVCRGFGATKNLASNSTNAEGASGATGDNYGHVSTSDSDGFTVTHTINGSDDGGTIRKGTHFSGNNYVAWCWDANGTGVSNTSGTISSTVSANTTAGFSIVSYTGNLTAGATVGHGLGVAPSMIVIKNRSSAGTEWLTYHKSLGNGKYLALQSNSAQAGSVTIWGTSSTTFTLAQAYGDYNGNGNSHVAYCFADVKGYSKFSSYTGNGSADGSFTYCGFSPALVIFKRTDSAGFNWVMSDNKRNTYNPIGTYLHPNLSSEDGIGSRDIDFLSNGFKIRNSNTTWNASGGTYIYMAFASNPFVSSKGIPTTAR
jgi:hypothetical protein